MNNTLSIIIIFIAGVVAGSTISRRYFKAKYELITNDEIESVKETFSWKVAGEPVGTVEKIEESDEGITVHANLNDAGKKLLKRKEERKADRAAAKDICTKAGYASYEEEEGDDEMDKPYVIPPEEFGEDYDVESLNYYTDGVLAYDDGSVVEDIDDLVGKDFADHFGEYEEDSVFIRNDLLQKDFEIMMDYRSYNEAYGG